MGQPAMMGLFTLKGMKAKDIHTELESLHGSAAGDLLRVKKWQRCVQPRRTDQFDE
jgi:hypothetical protein